MWITNRIGIEQVWYSEKEYKELEEKCRKLEEELKQAKEQRNEQH